MSTATLKRQSDMPQLVLEGILLDCGVPLCYWSEWFDLVYYGAPRSDAARTCEGSAAALQAILNELNKKCSFKFPPKNWKQARRKQAKRQRQRA